MRFTVTALLLSMSMLGCATVWNKPGATGDEFADAQLKCEAHVAMSCGGGEYSGFCRSMQFNRCMQTRGWTRE